MRGLNLSRIYYHTTWTKTINDILCTNSLKVSSCIQSRKNIVSRTTLSFHRYCAVQHPKPPNKTKVTVLEVHFISYIFFQDLASSFKIWGQHKHSSPHAKQSSGRTGNREDLAECTLNVVHFWTSKKDPILNPRFSSPWYPAENYPSSSTSLDTWHPDVDISSKFTKLYWFFAMTQIWRNLTDWTQWNWMLSCLNNPQFFWNMGKKNNLTGPHPCTKIIQQTFNDLHKELPIETMFSFPIEFCWTSWWIFYEITWALTKSWAKFAGFASSIGFRWIAATQTWTKAGAKTL